MSALPAVAASGTIVANNLVGVKHRWIINVCSSGGGDIRDDSGEQSSGSQTPVNYFMSAVPAVAASGTIVANSLVGVKQHTNMLESIGL
jgi:hypothetical protein